MITWHETVVNARSEMLNRMNEQFGRKRGRNGNMEWGAKFNCNHFARKRRLKGLTG